MTTLAIIFAFALMQTSAWIWINRSSAGFIIKTLAAFIMAASAAIFADQHGVETGISFSILLASCLLLFNVVFKKEQK